MKASSSEVQRRRRKVRDTWSAQLGPQGWGLAPWHNNLPYAAAECVYDDNKSVHSRCHKILTIW